MHFDWFFAHDLWKNRRMDDVTGNNVAFLTYKMTRFHVCTVIDHRISKKCWKNISDTLGCPSYATFMFLSHSGVRPGI